MKGTRIVYDASDAHLELPASLIPPPILVDRALAWAGGGLPKFDPMSRKRVYTSINRSRAGSVAHSARNEAGGRSMNDPLKLAEELRGLYCMYLDGARPLRDERLMRERRACSRRRGFCTAIR